MNLEKNKWKYKNVICCSLNYLNRNGQTAYEMGICLMSYFLIIIILTSALDQLLNQNVIDKLLKKQAYQFAVETTIAAKIADMREGTSFSIDYGKYRLANISTTLMINDTRGYNPAFVRWVNINATDVFTGRGIIRAWTVSRN